VQLHKHATQQGYATQSEAEPETPNPHTGRETGLNNLSGGLGETAHRSPAGGTLIIFIIINFHYYRFTEIYIIVVFRTHRAMFGLLAPPHPCSQRESPPLFTL
jgi:hypothetical protein